MSLYLDDYSIHSSLIAPSCPIHYGFRDGHTIDVPMVCKSGATAIRILKERRKRERDRHRDREKGGGGVGEKEGVIKRMKKGNI